MRISDWSSDVCSSDLGQWLKPYRPRTESRNRRSDVSIKTSLLLFAAVMLTAVGTAAADESRMLSDGACADSVDFAMRTAEHRNAGKTREEISQSIHDSLPVFKQQYPDIEEADMQALLGRVFEQRWTRFVAAQSPARACARHPQPTRSEE